MKYDIYRCNQGDTVRYTLGKTGTKKLFVVGLNPSTANKEKSDPTVAKSENVASKNHFDGFVMTNLYPLRSTNPKELPLTVEMSLIERNVQSILELVKEEKSPVFWAAWGENIRIRSYLFDSLNLIVEKVKNRWIHFGDLTTEGHPRHPSRLSYNWKFSDFDIVSYLKKFELRNG